MSGSLSSIPSLVPTRPNSSTTPRPRPADDESNYDRFSTLFSPATPRASPSGSCVDLAASNPLSVPPTRTKPSPVVPPSPDSEFGSFVSVTQDPLSASFDSPSTRPLSTSLDFFESFTEDAKQANKANKGVLDELLQHQDDPLYFLNLSSDETKHDAPPIPTARAPLVDLTKEGHTPTPRGNKPREEPQTPSKHGKAASESVRRSPSLDRPRSPLTLTKPSLARASSSISPATPEPSGSMSSSTPSLTAIQPSPPNSAPPSWSYTIGPRWMSSLISGSKSPPVRGASLGGLFDDPPATAQRLAQHAASLSSTAASAIANMIPDAKISHGTPFASHDFVPTSGAPGFSGEDHSWDKGYSQDFERARAQQRHVKLAGRKEGTSAVLTSNVVDLIRPHLPALSRLSRTWSLMYSLDQHGISLNTLYARCESEQPKMRDMGHAGALVVIQDANDAVFGAYVTEGIKLSRGAYYGSGESFLWRYVDNSFQVYKWTGKNEYIALCEPSFVSFGGGDGNYGLYVSESLMEGSSARCPTFGNEPLCSPAPKKAGAILFDCVGLEVWAIGP